MTIRPMNLGVWGDKGLVHIEPGVADVDTLRVRLAAHVSKRVPAVDEEVPVTGPGRGLFPQHADVDDAAYERDREDDVDVRITRHVLAEDPLFAACALPLPPAVPGPAALAPALAVPLASTLPHALAFTLPHAGRVLRTVQQMYVPCLWRSIHRRPPLA